MFKYPSIGQFRNAVHSVTLNAQYVGRDKNDDPVYDESKPLPKLTYEGTIKTHGTNAAIVLTYGESGFLEKYEVQSRSRIITPEDDNLGFARWVKENEQELLACFPKRSDCPTTLKIYGEWIGKGIQSGTAVNNMEKTFIIFSMQTDEKWIIPNDFKYLLKLGNSTPNIYTVYDFPTYEIEIDFAKPEDSQEKLADLTLSVENECPVGAKFGFKGIGEGIVWKCVTEGYDQNSRFWFKTKGEKHKVSKTKELVPVDIEKQNSIKALVASIVPEPRLKQGMEGKTFDRKYLGQFIKWVVMDVQKEELDTIEGNGFEFKEVSKEVSRVAREWFFSKEKL